MSDKLMELARRVEGLSGPDREVDLAIARIFRVTVWKRNDDDTANYETTHWRYTGSIDHALSLVPEGWSIALYSPSGDLTARAALSCAPRQHIGNNGASICLALCAAALRALASKGGAE